MTQNPGQWGPQGGYPPQGQGGYPPQQPPGGLSAPAARAGLPAAGRIPARSRGYSPPGATTAGRVRAAGRQPGYRPQGRLRPPGSGGGFPPQGGTAGQEEPGLIIGIVVAAVVLLVAIGGIIMVLNRGGETAASGVDHAEPAGSAHGAADRTAHGPADRSADRRSDDRSRRPTETSEPPSGNAIDLGNGIR